MALGASEPPARSPVAENVSGDHPRRRHPRWVGFQLPLRWLLVLPFVLQVSAAVGVTAYISIRNGQRAVKTLSAQLMESTTQGVRQHLDSYLSAPVAINAVSANLLAQGILDPAQPEALSDYFWQQAQAHPDISYIGFAADTGEYIGAGRWLEGYDVVIDEADASGNTLAYATDAEGDRIAIVDEYEYVAKEEAWYDLTLVSKQPIWMVVVEDLEPVYVAAGITQAVYGPDGQLLGVVGTDLILSDISEFLAQLLPVRGGRLFIMERNGQLIANSEPGTVLAGTERHNSLASEDALTQAAARHLQASSGDFSTLTANTLSQFDFQGAPHFVQAMPWQDEYGLDWLVVAVVPQSAFTAEIQENTRTTASLCLIALAIALLLGVITARWISQPVLHLSQASQEIATATRSNLPALLDRPVGRSHIQELEALAASFGQMAKQLQASFMELEATNAELEARVEARTADLSAAIKDLKRTQAQLIQTEKMSSLGQLVAGVAHEINNPVNFIHGNLFHLAGYTQDLLTLVNQLEHNHPELADAIQAEAKAIDLDFLRSDLPKILSSMRVGTERIRQIVLSLRNFSRLDEAEVKAIDLHEGIESTLLILQNRFKSRPDQPEIKLIRNYGPLPLVECYAGQINQVFMNLLANAIDALEEAIASPIWQATRPQPIITIQTAAQGDESVTVVVADNALGIPDKVRQHLFDPFVTTKGVGKGTGMGLSISYQIVTQNHHGTLTCESSPEKGTGFIMQIPVHRATHPDGDTDERRG